MSQATRSCGHFNADGTAYVIDRPDTPRPWYNYLTNGRYFAAVSPCGGGFSLSQYDEEDPITGVSMHDRSIDRPGRYLYIQDKATGHTWCPTYQPVRAAYDQYQAEHGLGYTTIRMTVAQIEAEITYFVPRQDSCEIWSITITNRSKKIRHLQLIPYIEWPHRQPASNRLKVTYSKRTGMIQAQGNGPVTGDAPDRSPEILFFRSSLPIKGYATQKEAFVGRNNSIENPEAVRTGKFKNTPVSTECASIAAFLHEVSLPPRKQKTFYIIRGHAEKASHIQQLIKKYRTVSKIDRELKEVKEYWKKIVTAGLQVQTPDPQFDVMVNTWLKYQTIISSYWSLSCSGAARNAQGGGYREACWDTEGLMGINAEHGGSLIDTLGKCVRQDGTVAAGYSPVFGPSDRIPDKDLPVWLTSVVYAYIKETGDRDILQKKLPFLRDRLISGWFTDPAFTGKPVFEGEATLYDHLWRNLDFCFHDVDASGLPRVGRADINRSIDTAGIKHKGGSVWLAQALVRSLKILARLSDVINEREKASELRKRATSMTERVEKFWDGEWYQRGVCDDASVYGTHKNKEGKIFLDAQVWALLSGIAQGERVHKIFRSIDKHLYGSPGYACCGPAFSQFDQRLGSITAFPKGVSGNGAVWCTDMAWLITALCLTGQGEKIYLVLKKILPAFQQDPDKYKAEPFWYAEYVIGTEHPYACGEGVHNCVSGSAGVLFSAVTEWMLGIRPELNGLMVDPCIPPHWKKIRIKRFFRGNEYDIVIENPHGAEKKIKEIYVNGEKIHGNIIVEREKGKKISVRVIMGHASVKDTRQAKVFAAL